MKNYSKIFFAAIIVFISCKENKKEVESVSETAIENSELGKYSNKFRKLIVTEDGVLRGFTFITDSSEIRRNETAQFLSSNPKAIAYTIEFNELEMADIIYHLKGNEVDTFEIDLYLKNKQATDSLANDFKSLYDTKYGSPVTNTDTLLMWKDSLENVQVKLKYINQDVDHGLNIYLYKNQEKDIVQ